MKRADCVGHFLQDISRIMFASNSWRQLKFRAWFKTKVTLLIKVEDDKLF